MVKEIILITGVSGFIGFASLIASLRANFCVRGVLRSSSQIPKLEGALSRALPLASELGKDVEFVIVPDLTAEGALVEVMEGVRYIFHVASPMNTQASEDYEEDYLYPAIRMSTNILEAASRTKSIKRIVVISSVSALIDIDGFVMGTLKKEPYTANDRLPQYSNGRAYAMPLLAYAAAKTKALDAAENWIIANKPDFDVVFLLPSLVLGANYLCEREADIYANTVGTLISFLRGHKAPFPSLSHTVSIDDQVEIMVKCVKHQETIPSGRYLVATAEHSWDDAKDIVKREFPEEVKSGKLSLQGQLGAMDWKMDVGDLEEVFGIQMKSFREVVLDTVAHYLTLRE